MKRVDGQDRQRSTYARTDTLGGKVAGRSGAGGAWQQAVQRCLSRGKEEYRSNWAAAALGSERVSASEEEEEEEEKDHLPLQMRVRRRGD